MSKFWPVKFLVCQKIRNLQKNYIKFVIATVRTRKLWNRKTTLNQYLSVLDDVTNQIIY